MYTERNQTNPSPLLLRGVSPDDPASILEAALGPHSKRIDDIFGECPPLLITFFFKGLRSESVSGLFISSLPKCKVQ